MAEQFKLPGSSFEEINKIIQGYATLDRAASLSDVSKTTGVPETTVSRNSGFLVSLGVIEPGAKKTPTELGRSLGRALMHGMEEEVRNLYAQIASENEFLKSIVGSVRIRKGMDESSLRSHIAYSADAKKGAYTTTGSGTVIEVLKAAGSLKDEDGKIVVVSGSSSNPSTAAPANSAAQSEPSTTPAVPPRQKFYGGPIPGMASVSVGSQGALLEIKINIDVTCNVSDLDGLGKKLKKVIEDLKAADEEATEDEDQNAAE